MAFYNIDTAEAIERISRSGIPRKQAEAIVATFAESNELLATKSDLDLVEERLGTQIKGVRA